MAAFFGGGEVRASPDGAMEEVFEISLKLGFPLLDISNQKWASTTPVGKFVHNNVSRLTYGCIHKLFA